MQLVHGDYSDTASAWNWLQAYSDIALCYTNPEGMFSDDGLYDRLAGFKSPWAISIMMMHLYNPLALLLHNINRINGDLFSVPVCLANSEGRLKLNDGYNEPDIYSKVLLKMCRIT